MHFPVIKSLLLHFLSLKIVIVQVAAIDFLSYENRFCPSRTLKLEKPYITSDECKEQCAANEDCEAAVYYTPDQYCYLKPRCDLNKASIHKGFTIYYKAASCDGISCENGASCVPKEANQFMCKCAPGYTGERCETNTNECASNPCMNGGQCLDFVNHYTCECLQGFSGEQCQIESEVVSAKNRKACKAKCSSWDDELKECTDFKFNKKTSKCLLTIAPKSTVDQIQNQPHQGSEQPQVIVENKKRNKKTGRKKRRYMDL